MLRGECLRIARSATLRALAREQSNRGTGKFDTLAYNVGLYTDDPTTAVYLVDVGSDLADVCKVSGIEFVATVTGEFPRDSVEAERSDPEYPRVAALLFRSVGTRCDRCWKHNVVDGTDLCRRCHDVVDTATTV